MKKRIVPKTTLILLLFTLLLAWSAVLPGRADSLIKSKEFTTRTFYADGDDDEVEFTENFGFAGDSYLNSGRFRMDITLTPVYNSIWISSDGERANLATEPAIVNLINGRLNARIDTATGGEFQPDYGSDGMIRSFRYSRSDLLSDDLTYANFTVTLPDEYAIESLFYQYGEDLEIDDVQYSVKFKIKVSIYGNAPGIKLKKKVLYGYINDIWYFIDVAELKGGNEKIVKATSSSPSVAVVSASTQRIRLKKVGTSKITLTNGYGRSATFTVKVQSSTITRRVSSVNCLVGTEMDLDSSGIVGILGTPRYTVKSSNSGGFVSVRKSLNHPVIYAKKPGYARLTFICGKKKFSVLVRSTEGLRGPRSFRYPHGRNQPFPLRSGKFQRHLYQQSGKPQRSSLPEALRKFQNSDAHSQQEFFRQDSHRKGTRDLQQRNEKDRHRKALALMTEKTTSVGGSGSWTLRFPQRPRNVLPHPRKP